MLECVYNKLYIFCCKINPPFKLIGQSLVNWAQWHFQTIFHYIISGTQVMLSDDNQLALIRPYLWSFDILNYSSKTKSQASFWFFINLVESRNHNVYGGNIFTTPKENPIPLMMLLGNPSFFADFFKHFKISGFNNVKKHYLHVLLWKR